MSELQSKCCLVFDHGLNLGLAERLARDDGFGRVLYHHPYEEGMSEFNKAVIGYGFDRVEHCRDIWKVKNEVDTWVFPDVENSGLQLELASQGLNVWGSHNGDSLELCREKFHKILGDVGLDVPKFRICNGWTELRTFLKSNEGPFYIKISRWRGTFETSMFRSWKLDEGLLDSWAVKFGPFKEDVPFMVFDPIETKLEIGGDTYSILGEWPDTMLHGDEAKDKAYISTVTNRDDMPPQIQDVLTAFAPVLKEHGLKNFWSMEVRVKDMHAYFGDATTRAPAPAIASQLEQYKNLPRIIYEGARGNLVQPEWAAKYSAELLVHLKGDEGLWATGIIPKELQQWIKPVDCAMRKGMLCFPPKFSGEVGWLVALDDDPKALVKKITGYAGLLPDGMSADLEPLSELLDIVAEAEDEGMQFGEASIPPPETVLT